MAFWKGLLKECLSNFYHPLFENDKNCLSIESKCKSLAFFKTLFKKDFFKELPPHLPFRTRLTGLKERLLEDYEKMIQLTDQFTSYLIRYSGINVNK